MNTIFQVLQPQEKYLQKLKAFCFRKNGSLILFPCIFRYLYIFIFIKQNIININYPVKFDTLD